ncbi:MAG: hypothetical protein HKO53_07650 [Gemmatimonadetes bacterium]|nr:hypothetical protein [Gemmatimonadota bacterium]
MRILVRHEYRVTRKEPFGDMLRRVLAGFEEAGLSPTVRASFSDSPVPGGVSAVQRALKKHPALEAFHRIEAGLLGGPPVPMIQSPEAGTLPVELILAVADGMPRSLPFNQASVAFSHERFGLLEDLGLPLMPIPGVVAGDSWWVNGRNRSLRAMFIVDGDAESESLPPPPVEVEAVLSRLGKPKTTGHLALPETGGAPLESPSESAVEDPGDPSALAGGRVQKVIDRYRSSITDRLADLDLPHDLPPRPGGSLGGSGPLKPGLVAAFRPLGYDCRGDSGVFTLRRRAPRGLVVDVVVDVGSWSRMVTAFYRVQGPAVLASVPLPVTKGEGVALQYPIGDETSWGRITENLATIVAEMDRTLVPEVEAAAGPTPEWFDPPR